MFLTVQPLRVGKMVEEGLLGVSAVVTVKITITPENYQTRYVASLKLSTSSILTCLIFS